ncbi:MAG: diaminopimelate decarboxylase [Gammaproteobacteria bacterium]|nr:diaminopimelate decarboxylase [Gammaproteobacteria bacterium]NNM00093.1 diaminopimelate decarboxylase [Gammaproteobacteria bacterium]
MDRVFTLRDGELHAEEVPLSAIAAAAGTPCYVYSRAALERGFSAWQSAFGARGHRVCYAVKANSSLAVLKLIADLGGSFDIVSEGELARVLAAGGDAAGVTFAGVGKREAEIAAALSAGIGCFNIESEGELERINMVAARLDKRAPVALRVNPDVDPQTHPYIATGLRESKFGVPTEAAPALYRRIDALPNVTAVGVACHIGSQITSIEPFADAVKKVVELAKQLEAQGNEIAHIDVGGGLGIRYRDEQPPDVAALVAAICAAVPERFTVHVEPGRSIAGPAGVLLTRVEYLKHAPERNFAIVDAAMNDLLRPALYQAWHACSPVVPRAGSTVSYDVVGPVCETGDFLAQQRDLDIETGDLLALGDAGAYGFVMASNYNSRPRPPEVLVDGDRFREIRRRETCDDLMAGELL